MSKFKFIDELRKLDIPAKAKADLAMLYTRAKKLARAILRFLKSHRQFGESLLLGALVAFLLSKVPFIGGFLGLCALVTAAAIGLMRELREDLTKLFDLDLDVNPDPNPA